MGRRKGHAHAPKRARMNPEVEEQPPLELEGENAFMNPLVLSTVFSFLGEEDLMSCRLVNSTWNQEAIPYLKVCCNVIDIQAPSAEEPSTEEYLEQFVNVIRSSDEFPFTKFSMRKSLKLIGSGPEWDSLMETIAPFTRELYFWGDYTNPSFTLPEGINFPELRRLATYWSDELDSELIPRIVDTAPKLRRLGLNDSTITQLEALTSKENLKLENLELLYYVNPDGEKHFRAHYNLLKSQRGNLEMLEITKNDWAPKHNRRISMNSFPLSFPKLKSLILYNVEASFLGDLFGGEEKGFHFATWFPVLKSLSVRFRDGDFLEGFQPGPPATSVQELEMYSGMDIAAHPLVLENVPRLFPTLTSLTISGVTSEKLWCLMEGFECLTRLELYSSSTTSALDQIFTGLSAEECKLMQGLTKRQFQEKWRNLNNQNPLESNPRCSALHKIQELSLNVNDSGVSDVSCRLVFLQMRNLKILKLRGEHHNSFAQISASVKKEMEETFQRVIITDN